MKKVAYTVAVYFGDRGFMHDSMVENRMFYVNKHLEFIKEAEDLISTVYFVVSNDIGENENYIKEIEKIRTKNIKILYRDNTGGSYCAWKEALHVDNNESNYMILLEDDYILANRESIHKLLEYWDEEPDLFHMCQWWNTTPLEMWGGIAQAHAAISNGMINVKQYNKLKVEHNLDFDLLYERGVHTIVRNQVFFLEPFRKYGCIFKDITDKYGSLFTSDKHTILEYGKPDSENIFLPIIDKFF